MDLCGPMRVQSINRKKYILVIVDDYSRFTWIKFLRSKDETPEFVINFLKQIQCWHISSKVYSENSSTKRHCQKMKSYTCGSSTYNADILKSTNVSMGRSLPSATAVNTQVIPPGIAEEPTLEDSPITHNTLHPSFNPVTGEPGSTQSSSGNVNSAEPNQVTQPPDHLRRWTKDHPLDNIVGNLSRPVSTRKQLVSDALWCCFHTELSKVEPKNFKMAVIEDCWFQAMQDEIYKFDRLEV
ncbi:retrovirus-related pol polyprotein from transposon TNT 1-94 [Tanacetum coccineum]